MNEGVSFESRISPTPFTDVTTLIIIIPPGENFHLAFHDIKEQELIKEAFLLAKFIQKVCMSDDLAEDVVVKSVSYTHLTLPTSDLV